MAKLTFLAQQLSNVFPLYYAVRNYKYSLGRMFLNSFASVYELEYNKMMSFMRGLYPRSSTRYDVKDVYLIPTEKTTELDYVMSVTGYVNNTLIETSCSGFADPAKFLDAYYFNTPQLVVSGGTTVKSVDVSFTNQLENSEYDVDLSLDFNNFEQITVVVSGSQAATGFTGELRRVVIEGMTKENPLSPSIEYVTAVADGCYKLTQHWIHISRVRCLNLKDVTVHIKGPCFNLDYRQCPTLYHTPYSRNGLTPRVSYDNEYGRFFIYNYVYNQIEDPFMFPYESFFVTDTSGVALTGGITDFDFEPMTNNLVVLKDDKVYYYDLYSEIPSYSKQIRNAAMCPYNLRFEVFDPDTITVIFENKYRTNPFDYAVSVVVVEPDKSRYVLNGDSTKSVDDGSYRNASYYKTRFKYSLDQRGVYLFYVKYYDTELKLHRSQAFLYNHEVREPKYSYTLTSSGLGINFIRRNKFAIKYADRIGFYEGFNWSSFYDNVNKSVAVIGINPTAINYNGSLIETDGADFNVAERILNYGEFVAIGAM